jgi:hypothetical protein
MRSNRPKSLGLLAALLVCAAAFLGIGAPAAGAAAAAQPGYGYLTTFAEGDLSNFATQPFEPIALDGSGNIVAVNENLQTIHFYAPDPTAGGTPLTTFMPPGFLPRDIAIDLGDDTIYAQDPGTFDGFLSIRRYLSDGKPTPSYSEDAGFEVPSGAGIAVDQASHNLLVADPEAGGIRRYEPDGTQLSTIAIPGVQPAWIAIAPDGSLYVAQSGGQTVLHLSSTGTELNQIAAAGAIESLAVDPASGRLLIAAGDRLDLYSTTGAFLSYTDTPEGSALGLAVDGSSGRVYEVSSAGFVINTYVPATWPGIEGPVVSGIEPHSVHFSAEVDPGAGPPDESEARFEWSDDGGATWSSTPEQALSGPQTIEADVSGITVNFDFLVRVTASNSLTSHTTAAVPFSTPETPPEVIPGAATDVTETSAVLNGTINPAGNQTTYYFEYGPTTDYGSRLPAGIDAVAGGERQNRAFKRTVVGLEPGTTYHYRLVAENALGVTHGPDVTFTTVAVGGIPHRAYEQVTPPVKNGNPVDPIFGFMARADGNAFNYGTRSGVQSSPLNARAVSFRESDDWRGGIDIDPPMNVYPEATVFATTLGLAPDFSRAFVTSNRKLTPEAVEGGTNLYVEDIASKTYTFVGSNESSFAMQFFAGIGNGGKFLTGAEDFEWIVFYSLFPLLPYAPFNAQYKWSEDGGLEVISVLPNDTEASVSAPSYYEKTSRMASEDASRLYFVSLEPEAGIFLREDGETRAISVSHVDGADATPQTGAFWGASEDGRYAFFSTNTTVPLTDDAPEVFGNVYRYDADEDNLEYLGDNAYAESYFTTLRSGYGVSDDGGTVYFRSGDDFGNGPNGMEVWREGSLKKFSSTVFPQHVGTWVSHNGRFIAFTGDEDLYRYDADTEETSCVSCMPDGSHGGGFFPGGGERITGNGVPNVVTEDGKVFFTSAARLVARDVNGMEDVYVFENGRNSLVSPGNAPFPAIFADISETGDDAFFSTSQKLVGRDNDGTVDVYDARVNGGLPKQSPPPPQECLRDDCKATPNAGPELPFGGSEALAGPQNVKPKPHRKHCGKGKRAKKVKGRVRCVKKHRAGKAGKGANR